MRRLLIAAVVFAFLACPRPARADLIDLGDGTILSTTLGYAFLRDFNTAQTTGYHADGLMWFDEGIAWIDHLNATAYLGHADWQLAGAVGERAQGNEQHRETRTIESLLELEAGLPSSDDIPYDLQSGGPTLTRNIDARRAMLSDQQIGPFVNVQSHYMVWDHNRRIEDCVPFCNPLYYHIVDDDYDQLSEAYVTAMRRVDLATVPEPATGLLLGLGAAVAFVQTRSLRRRGWKQQWARGASTGRREAIFLKRRLG